MMSVMGGKRFNLLVRLDSVDVPRLPSEPGQHLHKNTNTIVKIYGLGEFLPTHNLIF